MHRPRYDDWSLPKGKLDAGETWEDAAMREVEEETGLRCALGPELPPTSYRDNKDRFKVVRYWLMEATGDGPGFEPNDEVDELRWLSPARRAERTQLPARPRGAGGDRARRRVNRDRFPGLADGWARLDGPAGTQMVDVAIEAMADWMRSGRNANHGGAFAAARATDELVDERARERRRAARRRPAGRRLRAEHDRADDALRGRRRRARSSPATRWSARAWTTTPTSRRG